jgi:hypothetical protein
MKPLIIRTELSLWDAARKAAEAWILYFNTPDWDKHKKKLTQRVGDKQIGFDVHETKTGTIVVNLKS